MPGGIRCARVGYDSGPPPTQSRRAPHLLLGRILAPLPSAARTLSALVERRDDDHRSTRCGHHRVRMMIGHRRDVKSSSSSYARATIIAMGDRLSLQSRQLIVVTHTYNHLCSMTVIDAI